MLNYNEDKNWWNLDLECKPDFEECMKRIYAWYEGEIIDRPPVRFTAHNSFVGEKGPSNSWRSIKDKWFDTEFQVSHYWETIKGKKFLGETFPIFWPNLGPNVYASFYGCGLDFADVTSWAEPCLKEWDTLLNLVLNMNCEYFQKIEELTQHALELCPGRFMVGYTDLHPGIDCVAAWRDTQNLCVDLYDNSDNVKQAIDIAISDFQMIYDHFDAILKNHNQLSTTWMGIPSYGKMHIPSCDFSAMISGSHFTEYCLPVLEKEVKTMTHNIFHLDGKDVARHLDKILDIPEIQAIQWVQGMGDDKPIMQWAPLIKKILKAKKSIVVDLEIGELNDFIQTFEPEGIMLCLSINDEDDQKRIIKVLEKWH